jgi:peptide/nickel transport system substrate-binding protein
MKKGSADVESNVLTMDMVHALSDSPNLRVSTGPGARVDYLNFNVQDPALRDPRVRQAIAFAIDRSCPHRGSLARPRASRLHAASRPVTGPPHPNADLAQYPHNTAPRHRSSSTPPAYTPTATASAFTSP